MEEVKSKKTFEFKNITNCLKKTVAQLVEKVKKHYPTIARYFSMKCFAYLCIFLGLVLTFWFLYFGDFLKSNTINPDIDKIKNIQPFMSGIVLPAFTLGTTLLVIETFKNNIIQNVYNNVFKMIDQNRKILDSVNCDSSDAGADDIKSKGKDFFDDIAARISRTFSEVSLECPSSGRLLIMN